VVYSPPGETLGEALIRAADRAPVRGTMPCIVFRAEIDAELSKHGFDLPAARYRVFGRRRPVRIGFVESAAALFHNSKTDCLA
jgi:hypothetical protein